MQTATAPRTSPAPRRRKAKATTAAHAQPTAPAASTTRTFTIGPDVLDGGPAREVTTEHDPRTSARASVSLPDDPFDRAMPATLEAVLAAIREWTEVAPAHALDFARLAARFTAPDAPPADTRRAVLAHLAGADDWAALAGVQLDDGPTVGEAMAAMRDDPEAMAWAAAWRVVLRPGVPDSDVLDRVRRAAQASPDSNTRELANAALGANAWARVAQAEAGAGQAMRSLALVLDQMAATAARCVPQPLMSSTWAEAVSNARRAVAAFDPERPRPTVETATLPNDPIMGDVEPVRFTIRHSSLGRTWHSPASAGVARDGFDFHPAPASHAELHVELVRSLEVETYGAFLPAVDALVREGHGVERLGGLPENDSSMAEWLDVHLAAYALGENCWHALDRRDDVLAALDTKPLVRALAACWALFLRHELTPEQTAHLVGMVEPFEDDPKLGAVVEAALAPIRRRERKAAKAAPAVA